MAQRSNVSMKMLLSRMSAFCDPKAVESTSEHSQTLMNQSRSDEKEACQSTSEKESDPSHVFTPAFEAFFSKKMQNFEMEGLSAEMGGICLK
ncbi:unnamed protein product, partial [Heterosigma akashiwo]